MQTSMLPLEVRGGCSLPIKPSTFKNKRPEGRSRNFQGLNSTWNNAYSQVVIPCKLPPFISGSEFYYTQMLQ